LRDVNTGCANGNWQKKKIIIIIITICMIALNIWAFTGVISHGDFIDWFYYPILILLLCYIFYRYYPNFPELFVLFNLLIIIKYFDSLDKVEGFPYPDGAFIDFSIGLAYVLINIFFIILLSKSLFVILLIKSRTFPEIEIPTSKGGIFTENKKIVIILIVIFSILCYTPVISAPSSFIRQIAGAQLIQDDEEIYCVTKIDKEFICTLGGIEKSGSCYRRVGYAYDSIKRNYIYYEKEYPSVNNKYIYKRSFFLIYSGQYYGWSGTMDPQSTNMKDYYIDINHFFFKLSKKFKY